MTQATAASKTPERLSCVNGAASAPRRVATDPAVSGGPGTRCNSAMSTSERTYGLAPILRARLMGVALALIGVGLLVMSILVAVLELPADLLTLLVVLVLAAIFGLGFALSQRWYVVRIDDIGYQVRFVRGAGETRARWIDVEDLTTAVAAGTECVILRLRSGRSTTIPVNLIEGDRQEFVAELQRRLDAGHGYRRL